jgi:hypothetical protein
MIEVLQLSMCPINFNQKYFLILNAKLLVLFSSKKIKGKLKISIKYQVALEEVLTEKLENACIKNQKY